MPEFKQRVKAAVKPLKEDAVAKHQSRMKVMWIRGWTLQILSDLKSREEYFWPVTNVSRLKCVILIL
jgi:hypothetical protein